MITARKTWKTVLMASAMGMALATVPVLAQEERPAFSATDPLTVKVGEDIRVLLFNPSEQPLTVRVFAYNALEGSGDETEDIIIAPGKLRMFDFKSPREFTGILGYRIPPGAGRTILQAMVTNEIRASVQHRGPAGQSQTLGFSWGCAQGGCNGGGYIKAPATSKPAISGNWTISPAN